MRGRRPKRSPSSLSAIPVETPGLIFKLYSFKGYNEFKGQLENSV